MRIAVKYISEPNMDERKRWCRENIGSPGMEWYMIESSMFSDEYEFIFQKREYAMLFRLTFGNDCVVHYPEKV